MIDTKNKIYRQCVGIVLIKNGLIFAGKRFDVKNDNEKCWQMPQGGVNDNEMTDNAAYRELFEETGITKDNVRLICVYPEKLKYDFPQDVLKKNIGTKYEKFRGQEQSWFIFEFTGDDKDIKLDNFKEEIEFCDFKWVNSNFLINNIIDFKKDIYSKITSFLLKNNFCN